MIAWWWISKSYVCLFISQVNSFIITFIQVISRSFRQYILESLKRLIRLGWRHRSSLSLNNDGFRGSDSCILQKLSFRPFRPIILKITPIIYLRIFIWRLNNLLCFTIFVNIIRFLLLIFYCWYIWNWKPLYFTFWDNVILNMIIINRL